MFAMIVLVIRISIQSTIGLPYWTFIDGIYDQNIDNIYFNKV